MPHIREATRSDRDTLVAFNINLALETEGKHLAIEHIRPGVEALLADAAKGRYWLAEARGQVVGQIMVTYEWSDWRCAWFWWIQSVYVDADHRGQGVYRALFEQVKAAALASGEVCGLRLYVERDNTSALRTYDRCGLKPAGYEMREMLFEK